MRKRFNVGKYYERTKVGGDLDAVVVKNRHPAFPLANEPYCTRSQEVSYRERTSNLEVARCHQYLRLDNTLGLSGKPDPKRLYEGGVLYRLTKATPSE